MRTLVTGAGGNVAQGILRALDACGLASWIVTTDMDPMAVGLHVGDRGYVVPRATDPSFADAMIGIIRKERVDCVLAGAHAEIPSLASLRGRIEEETGTRVIVGSAEKVRRCHDKALTYEWLREVGIPHPETARSDDRDAVRSLLNRHGLPLIAKPREGFGSDGVLEVRDEEQLSAIHSPKILLQQLVGTPRDEYTAATFSDGDGRVRASVVMKRLLLRGTSYHVELTEDPEIQREVERWAEALGMVGSCNFQFRVHRGTPTLFEINYRFSGTTFIRAALGFNDVEMAVRHFVLGEPVGRPTMRRAVALRYWEELIIPGHDFESLSRFTRNSNGMTPWEDPASGV